MGDRDYMRDDYGRGGGFGGGGGVRVGLPRPTPVVKSLLIANGVAFLITFIYSFIDYDFIIEYLALNSKKPHLFLLQVFTYQFLHDLGGLKHLLGNMLCLYFFGTAVEGWLGRGRFLRLYLASGVAGAVGFLLMTLVLGIPGVCVGASGAVSGVVIYFCLVKPRAQVFLFFIPVYAWLLGTIYILIGVFGMLAQIRDGSGGIAHSAHLGGALLGFLFWRYEGLVRRLLAGVARRQAADRARRQEQDRAREDEILAKIHREGLTALTEKERRFLQEMAERRKKR